MAIRTAYVALPDLGEQLIAAASCPEKRDGLEFVRAISVVELEHKRVALTTIDAGMRTQVLINLATQVFTAGARTSPVARRLPCLVLSVVLSGVCPHARSTASST